MEKQLNWPLEAANKDSSTGFAWNQAGSNLCLDFHGCPQRAKLVVFSDGNHHMALEASCQAFLTAHPEVEDIFYATTPPKVIYESVLQGGVVLGNLKINIMPHVFISPENILDNLVATKHIKEHQAFARSKKNVLLVKKGNPKSIQHLPDLLRNDITLTISNPITETASYSVYKQTILETAHELKINITDFENLIDKNSKRVVFGESIHHREVPQTIFSGRADVALVYYHLALRYTRIFPDYFEIIELNASSYVQTDYHIGLINDGGEWGKRFLDFMLSDNISSIYKAHGLTSVNK